VTGEYVEGFAFASGGVVFEVDEGEADAVRRLRVDQRRADFVEHVEDRLGVDVLSDDQLVALRDLPDVVHDEVDLFVQRFRLVVAEVVVVDVADGGVEFLDAVFDVPEEVEHVVVQLDALEAAHVADHLDEAVGFSEGVEESLACFERAHLLHAVEDRVVVFERVEVPARNVALAHALDFDLFGERAVEAEGGELHGPLFGVLGELRVVDLDVRVQLFHVADHQVLLRALGHGAASQPEALELGAPVEHFGDHVRLLDASVAQTERLDVRPVQVELARVHDALVAVELGVHAAVFGQRGAEEAVAEGFAFCEELGHRAQALPQSFVLEQLAAQVAVPEAEGVVHQEDVGAGRHLPRGHQAEALFAGVFHQLETLACVEGLLLQLAVQGADQLFGQRHAVRGQLQRVSREEVELVRVEFAEVFRYLDHY